MLAAADFSLKCFIRPFLEQNVTKVAQNQSIEWNTKHVPLLNLFTFKKSTYIFKVLQKYIRFRRWRRFRRRNSCRCCRKMSIKQNISNGCDNSKFFSSTKSMEIIRIDGPNHSSTEPQFFQILSFYGNAMLVIVSEPFKIVMSIRSNNIIFLMD